MKYLLPLFLLFSINTFSQDKIVTLSNDTIDCKITNITEYIVQFEIKGKNSKMMFSSVSSVYQDGKWDYNELADRYSQAPATEESIMKRQPQFMAAGVSEKQKNHVYSAGIFIEKGSGKMIGGIAVTMLATGIGILFAEEDPTFGGIIAIGGSVVGLVLTIGGINDLQKAGRELQSFPYE